MKIFFWFKLFFLFFVFTAGFCFGLDETNIQKTNPLTEVILEGQLTMPIVVGEKASPVLLTEEKIYKLELSSQTITFRFGQYYQIRGELDNKASSIHVKEMKLIEPPGSKAPVVKNNDGGEKQKKKTPDKIVQKTSIEKISTHDQLIAKYSNDIRTNPKDANAYYQRGSIWFYKKEYERAVKDFSQAISIKSGYIAALNRRGQAYAKLKKMSKACEDYKKACDSGSCKLFDDARKAGICRDEKKKPKILVKPAPKPKPRYVSPLEKISLDQIRAVTIINMPGGFKAIVEDTETGKGYMVKQGSYMGLNSGRIKKITEKKIIVEEKHKIGDGWAEKRIVEFEP